MGGWLSKLLTPGMASWMLTLEDLPPSPPKRGKKAPAPDNGGAPATAQKRKRGTKADEDDAAHSGDAAASSASAMAPPKKKKRAPKNDSAAASAASAAPAAAAASSPKKKSKNVKMPAPISALARLQADAAWDYEAFPGERVTLGTAKSNFFLNDKDLQGVPYEAAENPHYASVAPMRLYETTDLLILCHAK